MNAILQKASAAFRECLDAGDSARLRQIWSAVYPNMPGLPDRATADIVLHHARTESETLRLEARLYSHAWLSERGHKSALPRELRPEDERGRSIIVTGIGIACRSSSGNIDLQQLAKATEKVMGDAGAEMLLAGITDKAQITAYMWQRRDAFIAGRLRREF